MTEHEVRCAVDECLEAACESAIRGQDDARIAEALLEHREQRFRLSYPLGNWRQVQPGLSMDDEYDMDFDEPHEADEGDSLPDDETVGSTEIEENNDRLSRYVDRIKAIATAVGPIVAQERGEFLGLKNANQRQDWLEYFTNALYENQDFGQLSLDIMDVLTDRFGLTEAGEFERSATGLAYDLALRRRRPRVIPAASPLV